ncbi:MAG: uracil-DNA glycosylase [Candidatus Pacebacteria bacterium]|nr:uracil-DNA glycosylase [Candidatus Paceibacterota bacterium]
MTCGWEDLSRLVQTCHRCSLHKSRTNVVFGEGDPHARIMFIGEGPGFDEDQSGRPFVGRAGQLLTKMIQAMQLSREEVFIGNIVKCRPPGNRTPHEDEAEACLPFLRRQIELIQPDILVLLGATPLKYILGKTGITRLHGTWHDVNGIATIPTFHPSYLLRSPQRKRDVWEDLKKVMARIGKDPEETMRKVRRQD